RFCGWAGHRGRGCERGRRGGEPQELPSVGAMTQRVTPGTASRHYSITVKLRRWNDSHQAKVGMNRYKSWINVRAADCAWRCATMRELYQSIPILAWTRIIGFPRLDRAAKSPAPDLTLPGTDIVFERGNGMTAGPLLGIPLHWLGG